MSRPVPRRGREPGYNNSLASRGVGLTRIGELVPRVLLDLAATTPTTTTVRLRRLAHHLTGVQPRREAA